MRRVGSFVRLRARLHGDERGFSLLETVVAVTIIFGLMLALEGTATLGFRYTAFARERQSSNHIANQIMEEIRGLAYSNVQQGLKATDVTSDPNIVTACAGDPVGTYRFLSCTGEKIVYTSGLANLVPLVPNNGTCPGSGLPLCPSGSYPVTYSWRTYVTNNNTAKNPYAVTVLLTWTSKSIPSTATQQIKMQSLFWSPAGCVSSSTHPFAAPCQPYFYGQALYPQGSVSLSGTVSGTSFQSGTLYPTSGESDLQQEQVAQGQAYLSGTGTSITDGSGTSTGGSTTTQTVATDGDPASSALPYASSSLSGSGSSLSSSGGGNSITVSNAAGDSGTINSAMLAGGSQVCPPPPATAETDSLPCSGSKVQQAGALSAIANITSTNPDLNSITIAQVAAPGAASTTLANRNAISGQDGIVQQTTNRTIGQMDIGGIPSWISSNCTGLGAFTGYFVSLTGYSDTAQATAGSSAPAPAATINGGTLKYWTGSGYTNVALQSTPGYSFPANWTQTVGCTKLGRTVTATLKTIGTVAMASQPATASTPSGSGSIARTDTQATVGSPVFGQFQYTLVFGTTTIMDTVITVDLGTIYSKATYQAAPAAG